MLKRTLALAAGFALSLSASLTQAAEVLRVSAIPDEAPTELLRKFKPLGAYLEQQLGMKVEFTPVADYPAVVEALAEKDKNTANSQKTVRHRICIKPWAGVDVLTLGLNIPEFMQ